MAEEKRKPDDKLLDFLERLTVLEAGFDRLTEHEKADKPRYEEWRQEEVKRLVDLEKTRGELGVAAKHEIDAAKKEAEIRKRVDEAVNGKLAKLDDGQRKQERIIVWASGAATVIISLVVIIVGVLTKHL
jgi:hypothetical protein